MALNFTTRLHLENAQDQVNLTLGLVLGALLFSIPISNSAKSITFVIAVILLFATKVNIHSLRYLIRQPWVLAIISFLILTLVACAWSPAAWSKQFFVVNKYTKLLCVPLLALGFADKNIRNWGLHAFLAAMLLTCLVAIAKTISPVYLHNDIPGNVFRNYIMTGNMMSFASYLAAYFAITKPTLRLPYTLLFLLFSFQVLFLSQGRTGYIIYFVMLSLLTVQMLNKKQLLTGMLAIGILGGLVYHLSPKMQDGFHKIQNNIVQFQQGNKNTSVGLRLQFQLFAFELFKESPVFGHGTGSFTYYFDQRHPVPAWNRQLREPHNQYWLIAAEYGLFGLLLYFTLLATLIYACFQLKEMKNIAMALLIPFMIGCFSDTLLFHSGSGYFFLALLALCLGESVAIRNHGASISNRIK